MIGRDLGLIRIPSDDYKRILQRFHLNRRTAVMKWLRREIPILSDFSEHKLKFFESVSVDVVVKKGDIIYTEGDEIGAIYFIKEGSVRLDKHVTYQRHHRHPSTLHSWSTSVHKIRNTIELSLQKAGDFFGVELFLQHTARTHTAVAETGTHLIAINKEKAR